MSDRRVVSDAELNRATLARQLLLHRIELDPVTAISRLFALQAQEPPSPYLALWTRLKDFDPPALDHAFASWAVVKATLMRMTLHVVAAEDYPSFWATHAGSLCRARTRWFASPRRTPHPSGSTNSSRKRSRSQRSPGQTRT